MKACPTCGREIAAPASACDACEAWAAAVGTVPRQPDETPAAASPAVAEPAPVTLAQPGDGKPVPAPAARRQRTLVLGGVGAVVALALTGFALSAGGASTPAAPVTAAPRAAEVRSAPPAPKSVPRVTTTAQTWSTSVLWQGRQRRGTEFELPSENAVATWVGPARPALVVRCTSRSIEAFVLARSPMKIEPRVDGKTVTLSLDGEPARTELWTDADDRTAVFAPDPAAFVQRLRTARSFALGFTPHNSPNVVAQFHVAGIDALLRAAAKDCGVPK